MPLPAQSPRSPLARTLGILSLTAALMAFGLTAAEAQRLALVVGNSDYAQLPKLGNAATDATALAETLRRLGFEVTLLTDVGAADIQDSIEAFSAAAETAESTVFYYAGHAFQVNGVNYLVPVDAALQSREATRTETWSLDGIIARIQDRRRQTLIFLDAGRNDPVPKSVRGSAPVDGLARMQTGAGTFVAFAAEPGSVIDDGAGDAPNSVFTAALLKNLEEEGLSISDLMIKVRNEVSETTAGRQSPWYQSSLREQFYFRAAAAARQELSEADYELLAQLTPEDRAKFLDLLRESGFSDESLKQADDAIVIASYNLEVAADTSVLFEEVTDADVAAAPATAEPELALEVIDDGSVVAGLAEDAAVPEAAAPELDLAALTPALRPAPRPAPNPNLPPAPVPEVSAEAATAPDLSAPDLSAPVATAIAPVPAPPAVVAAAAPAPAAPAAADPAAVEAAPQVVATARPAPVTERPVADGGASVAETVVAALPAPAPPLLAPLGATADAAPVRLAALTWQAAGIEAFDAVAGDSARVTGSPVLPDSDANRAFLASIDPTLLIDEAVVVNPADLKREAQAELARLGCYRMAVDGAWGRGSRTALTSYFLAKRAVPDTLEPTVELVSQLKRETQVICEVQVARARVVPGKTKAILPQKAVATEGKVAVRASPGRKAVTVEKAKKNITKQLSGGMGFN